MCLLNPANPAIARQRDEVIRQLMDTNSPRYHERIHDAQKVMSELMRVPCEVPLPDEAFDGTLCQWCKGTGRMVATYEYRGMPEYIEGDCPECDGLGIAIELEPIGYDDYESGWPGSRLAS